MKEEKIKTKAIKIKLLGDDAVGKSAIINSVIICCVFPSFLIDACPVVVLSCAQERIPISYF